MPKAMKLSEEEKYVVQKLNSYFKPGNMSFEERVFNALLITRYDLEAHHFSNDKQRRTLIKYQNVLDGLLKKMNSSV